MEIVPRGGIVPAAPARAWGPGAQPSQGVVHEIVHQKPLRNQDAPGHRREQQWPPGLGERGLGAAGGLGEVPGAAHPAPEARGLSGQRARAQGRAHAHPPARGDHRGRGCPAAGGRHQPHRLRDRWPDLLAQRQVQRAQRVGGAHGGHEPHPALHHPVADQLRELRHETRARRAEPPRHKARRAAAGVFAAAGGEPETQGVSA